MGRGAVVCEYSVFLCCPVCLWPGLYLLHTAAVRAAASARCCHVTLILLGLVRRTMFTRCRAVQAPGCVWGWRSFLATCSRRIWHTLCIRSASKDRRHQIKRHKNLILFRTDSGVLLALTYATSLLGLTERERVQNNNREFFHVLYGMSIYPEFRSQI